MFELSIRAKSYLVIILMITCFGLLYPKILHPMLLNILGLTTKEPVHNDFIHPRERHMRMKPGGPKSPQSGHVNVEQNSRGGGVMTMILPVYAIGIVFYLVYTLAKVFGSDKSKTKQNKRESVLKNYYKDFHFDPLDGDFKLNYSESSNQNLIDDITKQASYCYQSPNDIYNCTKSLPHDLEVLLQKVDDKNISENEMRQLRLRLEETESQLTRILRAMEHLEAEPEVNESHIQNGSNTFSEEQKEVYVDEGVAEENESQQAGNQSKPETFQDCVEDDDEYVEDLGVLKQRKIHTIPVGDN